MKGLIDVRELLLLFEDIKPRDIISHCKVDDVVGTFLPIDSDDHKINLIVNNSREVFYFNAYKDLFYVFFVITERNNKKYFLRERQSGQQAVWSLYEFRAFLTQEHAEDFIKKCKTSQEYKIKHADVDTLI